MSASKQSHYSVEQRDVTGEWFVYDLSQDIYVNRFGYVADYGFLTKPEAISSKKFLEDAL